MNSIQLYSWLQVQLHAASGHSDQLLTDKTITEEEEKAQSRHTKIIDG